jgi:hypothetical protein
MSMIGNVRLSTDAEIQSLLDDPESITEYLYPEDETQMDPEDLLDIDKSWHAIHMLLCGDPWEGEAPLAFIVAGGRPVGDVDLGYGPARVFGSTEVADIAEALAAVSTADLKARFSAAAFMEEQIYPQIWNEPESECLDGYILPQFERLKAFLTQGARTGRALVVYLD